MAKGMILLLALFFFFTTCKSQTSPEEKTIYNEDFKWTITIPAGFDTMSAEHWAKLQKRGTEAMEKTYDAKVENYSKTIFVFQSDRFNYFESNYQPFDPAKDGSYLTALQQTKKMVYGTFKAQMQGTKIDSSSAAQTIGGLTFQSFHVVMTFPNGMVMNWEMFTRLFGKKEFTVNIMTIDKQKEKDLLVAWTNSKFGK